MTFATHGTGISDVEVTNISAHGFWLLVAERELFVAFDDFPWFRSATVAQIVAVEAFGNGHLRWPSLDVDLSIRSIEKPADFPLISRV